ncbi:SEC-C metal-binding domain-containing protein [Aquibacillus sediminis]|uniref:SEC-C metal-binding domain-containing protein n=1 Tax=Aquibacillus sediminis TaxID=2574734 RepID=UPI001FE4F2CB|nr:SEC-C metal-binding domain-containing protein [Aquibacillus sediminis]
MNQGEQILSDLVVALKELYPNIEVENTKNKLSTVLFKPIQISSNKDNNISFFDYSLVKDPYQELGGEFPQYNQTRRSKKIGRNEKCPCGSGKKYKKCCGK